LNNTILQIDRDTVRKKYFHDSSCFVDDYSCVLLFLEADHEHTNIAVRDVIDDENGSGGCNDNMNSELGQSANGPEVGSLKNNVQNSEPVNEVVSKMSVESSIVEVRNDSGEMFASKGNSEVSEVETADTFELSIVKNCVGDCAGYDDRERQPVSDIGSSSEELRTFSNGADDHNKRLSSDVDNDKRSSVFGDNIVDNNSAQYGEEHGLFPVDAADRSYDCFTDLSFDARYGMLNGCHSPSPGGDMCNDEITERGKQAKKIEQRHRAMLAAMETAGVRQKPAGKAYSLNSSLLHFTAVETLSGNNMLACSSCNSVKQKTNEATGTDVGANGG